MKFYQSEDLSPTTPTHREQKVKENIVKDKFGASSVSQQIKISPISKLASPTSSNKGSAKIIP